MRSRNVLYAVLQRSCFSTTVRIVDMKVAFLVLFGLMLNVPATRLCTSGTIVLFMCRHTELELADQTYYLSQCTDTRQNIPSTAPVTSVTPAGQLPRTKFLSHGRDRTREKQGKIPVSPATEDNVLPLCHRRHCLSSPSRWPSG